MLLVLTSYFLVVSSETVDRNAKWFFYPRTVTKYLREKSFVTETIPSSCVIIPESLSMCRHAKQLQIEPAITQKYLTILLFFFSFDLPKTKLFVFFKYELPLPRDKI